MGSTPHDINASSLKGITLTLGRSLRDVTGTIALDRPNPKRRSECKVSYHIRHSWTSDEEDAAVRVAVHWFQRIGGIVLLRNCHLSHIISRFKASVKAGGDIATTEKCMHWAIVAYASSEWHRENKRWTTIGRFFKDDHYDQWLENSQPYQDVLRKQARQRCDAQAKQQASQQRTAVAAAPAISELDDGALTRVYGVVKRYSTTRKATHDAARRQAFSGLRPNRRIPLVAQMRAIEAKQPGRHDADFDARAEQRCWTEALNLKIRNEQTTLTAILNLPRCQVPYSATAIDAEIQRRACLDAPWLLKAAGSFRRLDETLRDTLNAAIHLRVEAWHAGEPHVAPKGEAKIRETLEHSN